MDTDAVTPAAAVDAYRQHRQGTQALLADLEGAILEGNHSEVRDRVRSFARENRDVFVAVTLSLTGTEGFFHEVENHIGEEEAEDLRELGEQYESLADVFHLVRLEVTKERRNPVTSIDVRTAYSTRQERPVVGYTISSGDVELFESQGTTTEVLQTAGYLLQAANDSLSAALADGHSVNTDELSGLIDRHQQLNTELGTLQDHIDDLRRKPVEE